MPPKRSIDLALSSMIGDAVRDAVKDDISELKREVRKLQRRMERIGTAGARVRRGKGKPGRKPKFLTCQVVGCKGKPVAWGFCQTHYNRFKYRGSLKRLAARVNKGEQIRDDGKDGRTRAGRAKKAAPARARKAPRRKAAARRKGAKRKKK
jgi:hypothetical protein